MIYEGPGLLKKARINAGFSRKFPIRVKAYSKKSAFDHSSGVSVILAKVSKRVF
jgi:hypothetical protein